MKFSYSIHVLCSCRLGQKCPDLWRKDGSWKSRHGSAGWAARIPTTEGTKAVKRYGYESKKNAEQAAQHVGKLLDLAPDEVTRARIGDLITGTKRGAPLPAVEDVRRRLGLGLDPGQPGVTVGQWLDGWLASKARTRRASTVRMYDSHTGCTSSQRSVACRWSGSTRPTSRLCWLPCPVRPRRSTGFWPP
jgi:hypothetical protein